MNKQKDSRIKQFLDFAFETMKAELEIPPSINYRICGDLLKDRLRECDLDEMKEMLRFALNGGKDTFWEGSGYSLQVFLAATTFQRIRLCRRRNHIERNQSEAFIPYDEWKAKCMAKEMERIKAQSEANRKKKEQT